MRYLTIAMMILSTCLPAMAATDPAVRLSSGNSFTAPIGFQIFCLQNAAHCRGGGAGEVALTQGLIDTLKAINGRVNRAITPRAERQDIWALGVTRGDCEDYVLAKRAALIEAGLPGAALRIAAAVTRNGEGHAVLVIRTDGGDLVLDNLTPSIKPVNQTSLSFVAMTAADGRSWKRVS